MRILLDNTSEIGLRTGHMFMGQESVEHVGIWRSEGARRSARSGPADDVEGFDVIVSDRRDMHGELVARASVAGIPIVLWDDARDVPPGNAPVPIVRGANLAAALGPALAAHVAADDADAELTIGRTEPGEPLTSGATVRFPAPVGPLYGSVSNGTIVAPHDGPWAAMSVSVRSAGNESVIGVADHLERLEAFSLAAAGLAAANGAYGDGLKEASSSPSAMFEALTLLELDVAVWRSHH